MKIILSINGCNFEIPENVKNIKIDMTNNHNFDTNTDTDIDEDTYTPIRQKKVVYTITLYSTDVFRDKKTDWGRRDVVVEKKANDEDEAREIIQKYIKEHPLCEKFSMKVQHFGKNDTVIYEKDFGDFEITNCIDILTEKDYKELKSYGYLFYKSFLNNIRWFIDDHINENHMIKSRFENIIEVDDYPKGVSLVSPDITKLIYWAKEK